MNGWRLIRRHELTYLRGVARGAAKMQRQSAAGREHTQRLLRGHEKLREQIACDQRYIDLLEERLDPVLLKEARMLMAEERRRG